MSDSQTPFQLLFEIDQRCRALAAGLPAQQQVVQSWSGIGFRMGERLFVAPMGEVSEVLHEPRYTSLPGVKSWVKGVANVRGRLLPPDRGARARGRDSRAAHRPGPGRPAGHGEGPFGLVRGAGSPRALRHLCRAPAGLSALRREWPVLQGGAALFDDDLLSEFPESVQRQGADVGHSPGEGDHFGSGSDGEQCADFRGHHPCGACRVSVDVGVDT